MGLASRMAGLGAPPPGGGHASYPPPPGAAPATYSPPLPAGGAPLGYPPPSGASGYPALPGAAPSPYGAPQPANGSYGAPAPAYSASSSTPALGGVAYGASPSSNGNPFARPQPSAYGTPATGAPTGKYPSASGATAPSAPGPPGAPLNPYGAPVSLPSTNPFGAPSAASGPYGAPQPQLQPSAPYGASTPSPYSAHTPAPYGTPAPAPYGAPAPGPYGAPTPAPYGVQPGAPPAGGAYGAPGQPYGASPAGGAYGLPQKVNPAQNARFRQAVYQRLVTTIQSNGISTFYPQAQLDQVLEKALAVDYEALAQRWRLPSVELALDLASLSLYDIVLFCDDSGSMSYEQDGSRIDDLKAVVEKVAEVVTLFDDDGLVVRFFNSPVRGDGVRTPAEVSQLVQQVRFSGSTPMGEKLETEVLQQIVYSQPNLPKPILIITITDGVPDSQEAVLRAMASCKQRMSATRFGAKAVAFEFAQVGNDMAAMRWLATLDNNPSIGDIVDSTSNFEAEEMEWRRKNPANELSPGLWLLKLMLGAIDPQYDDKD